MTPYGFLNVCLRIATDFQWQVRGVPGSNLQYDELIVYEAEQIRPLYLVVYR